MGRAKALADQIFAIEQDMACLNKKKPRSSGRLGFTALGETDLPVKRGAATADRGFLGSTTGAPALSQALQEEIATVTRRLVSTKAGSCRLFAGGNTGGGDFTGKGLCRRGLADTERW